MKSRSDSVLKTLAEQSDEFGEKLFAWCQAKKTETCVGGYQYARAQLAADGITLGSWRRQLSEFYSWWEMRQDFREADDQAANVQELLKSLNLGLTQQQIDAAGQLVFTQRALAARDAEEFREMEYLRVTKESARLKGELEMAKLDLRKIAETRQQQNTQLAIDKFQFDAARAALAHLQELRTIAADRALSAPEKVKAVQLKLFGTPRTALEAPSA
jgi:hypothetical protein